MKKEKKAFKDTIFGKIVGKAGNVLTDVPGIIAKAASGNYLGAVSDVMGQFVRNEKGSAEAKELLDELALKMKEIELEFARVELEETRIKEENVTKRWEADMHSDSWLSKNMRPIGLGWVLTMITTLMIISWAGIETPDQVLMMFGGISSSIVGGYYILRTVEKRNDKKYNK